MAEEAHLFRLCAVFDKLGEPDGQLAQVVGAEGGGHGNALRLPEGVVLHGADEVDGDLSDLVGGGLGDQTQNNNSNNLDDDKQRVPADQMELFDGAGNGF